MEEIAEKPKRVFYRRRYGKRRVKPKSNLRGARAGAKVKGVPMTAVGLRAEHYYMARELAEFYQAPLMRTLGAIVVREYCRVLYKSDPAKAAQIEEAYKNDENQAKYIVDLAH
jgi:hypothetical protein